MPFTLAMVYIGRLSLIDLVGKNRSLQVYTIYPRIDPAKDEFSEKF
jgi:hypothetical protein